MVSGQTFLRKTRVTVSGSTSFGVNRRRSRNDVGTPWGYALSRLEADASLQEMEDIDSAYYCDALDAIRGPKSTLLEKYIQIEIDHRNIVNQFRGLVEINGEDRDALMIGGGKISKQAQNCINGRFE